MEDDDVLTGQSRNDAVENELLGFNFCSGVRDTHPVSRSNWNRRIFLSIFHQYQLTIILQRTGRRARSRLSRIFSWCTSSTLRTNARRRKDTRWSSGRICATATPLWSAAAGGPEPDRGLGVAMDGTGAVYVTATFQSPVDFGGGELLTPEPGQFGSALVKYAP